MKNHQSKNHHQTSIMKPIINNQSTINLIDEHLIYQAKHVLVAINKMKLFNQTDKNMINLLTPLETELFKLQELCLKPSLSYIKTKEQIAKYWYGGLELDGVRILYPFVAKPDISRCADETIRILL